MKSVIFDLDGTLADTSKDLIAAANACFEGLGVRAQLDPVTDAQTAFHGGRAMLRLGFSRLGRAWDDGDVDAQFPVLLGYYGDHIDVYSTLYPGVKAALDALAGDGFALGICTNKPGVLADRLLANLGIRSMFGALFGADTLPLRKPDPAPLLGAIKALGAVPARSALIGDTLNDRQAARSAGVASVLVTFGPTGRAVEGLKPEALLDHYDDLPGLMARMIV